MTWRTVHWCTDFNMSYNTTERSCWLSAQSFIPTERKSWNSVEQNIVNWISNIFWVKQWSHLAGQVCIIPWDEKVKKQIFRYVWYTDANSEKNGFNNLLTFCCNSCDTFCSMYFVLWILDTRQLKNEYGSNEGSFLKNILAKGH